MIAIKKRGRLKKRKEMEMNKIYVKAETTGYEGNGEFWVRVVNDEQSRLIEEDYIFTPEDLSETITADEITGTLGQLLNEVDLPADLYNQVQDLYNQAVKFL